MRSGWVLAALFSALPAVAPRRLVRRRPAAGEGPTAWSAAAASLHGAPEGPLRTALAQAAEWGTRADPVHEHDEDYEAPEWEARFHLGLECAELGGLGVGLSAGTRGDAVTLWEASNMSRWRCYRFCAEHRTLYFGVSRGDRCTCFDTFESRAASKGCTTPCLGNASETCGGAEAYDVGLNVLWQKERDGSSCGAPPAVRNAHKTCADFGGQQPGGRCGVVCQDGYHLESNTLVCNSQTGHWFGHARCHEIKCTMLPPIQHSSRWCFGASAVEDDGACEVDCMPGYRLTSNTLKCNGHLPGQPSASSIGYFTGEAHCTPVGCGKLEPIKSGRIVQKEFFYPETAIQRCMGGFTHNGLPSGRTEFATQCQQDGAFAPLGPTDRCQPVKCGAPPYIGNATVMSHNGTLPRELRFPDSVMYKCKEGFSTDGSQHGVEPFTVACAGDGHLSEAPECVPVSCGQPPQLPLAAAERPDEARGYGDVLKYRCQEGASLNSIDPGDVHFSVRCNGDGQFSGARECVRVKCGPAPMLPEALVVDHDMFSGDVAKYVCKEGYTVSGSPAGDHTFHSECMPNGSFSKPIGCKPVKCLSPPLLIHAGLTPEALSLFDKGVYYLDVLTYQCNEGYHMANKAPGGFIECTATGQFSHAQMCTKMTFNTTTATTTADLTTTTTTTSTTTVTTTTVTTTTVTTTTMTTTTITTTTTTRTTTPCPSPTTSTTVTTITTITSTTTTTTTSTTVTSTTTTTTITTTTTTTTTTVTTTTTKTTTTTTTTSTKTTTTTPLSCGEGFELVAQWRLGAAHDEVMACERRSCGEPPDSQTFRATASGGKMAFGDAREYTCLAGHTIDGSASAPAGFAVTCNADGELEGFQTCVPVSCGRPPVVQQASVPALTAGIFSDRVTYTCAEGHTNTGTLIGNGTVHATCGGDGVWQFDSVVAVDCMPISCGAPPEMAMTFVDPNPVPLGGKVVYRCAEGHAVHPLKPEENSFVATCTSDGSFDFPWAHACVLVVCENAPPRARIVDRELPVVWSMTTHFECEEGTTVTGTVPATRQFTARCGEKGTLDSMDSCHPIACFAKDAHVANAKAVADSALVGESLGFQCEEGYAVDALRLGANDTGSSFELTCLESGYWSRAPRCDNVDDCAGHTCGPFGTCVDGVGNYSCWCPLGKETEVDGEKVCGDYGTGVCGPEDCGPHGLCVDIGLLPKAWICQCEEGYVNQGGVNRGKCVPQRCPHPEHPLTTKLLQKASKAKVARHNSSMVISHSRQKSAASGLSPEPGCRDELEAHVDLDMYRSTVAHSNLGGRGPDSGEESLRFTGLGTAGDAHIDLVITATSEYAPDWQYELSNGLSGQFGMISLPIGQCVDLVFTFVDHATGQPYELDAFDITFFDLDAASNVAGMFSEDVIVSDWDSYAVSDETMITHQVLDDGRLSASCGEIKEATPTDPMILTDAQLSRAVAVYFKHKSTVQVTIRAPYKFPVVGRRKFLWAFASAAAPQPPPCPAPEPVGGVPFPHYVSQECELGTSVDGSGDRASSHFGVRCAGDAMEPAPECVPVSCGLPPLKANMVASDPTREVLFRDVVSYTCNEGYSLDGTGSGETRQSLVCLTSGMLEVAQTCKLVECKVPHLRNGSVQDLAYLLAPGSSHCPRKHRVRDLDACRDDIKQLGVEGGLAEVETGGPGGCSVHGDHMGYWRTASHGSGLEGASPVCEREAMYKEYMLYRCDRGFSFDASDPEKATVSRMCMADGKLEEPPPDRQTCVPVQCGHPPRVAGASYDDRSHAFGEKVTYTCDDDKTVDGTLHGLTSFAVECESSGMFSQLVTRTCYEPVFPVEGTVVDARTFVPVPKAQVSVGSGPPVWTNEMGRFLVHNVSIGKHLMVVSREGYEDAERNLTVSGELGHAHVAGNLLADVALVAVLKEGDYLVTLQWEEAHDMDLHAYLSTPGPGAHLSWKRREAAVEGLDASVTGAGMGVDVTQKDGIEHVIFSDVSSHCRGLSECRIAIRVHSQTEACLAPKDTPWRIDDCFRNASVTVTDHTGKRAEYWGREAQGLWWTVFVLDGLSGTLYKCSDVDCAGAPGAKEKEVGGLPAPSAKEKEKEEGTEKEKEKDQDQDKDKGKGKGKDKDQEKETA